MLEGIKNLLKLEEEYDIEENNDMYEEEEEIETTRPQVVRQITEVSTIKERKGKEKYNIIISRPTKLEDAKNIIDLLVEGNSVTIDLAKAEEKIRQRILDMVFGYGYYAECNIEQVTSTIFLISHEKISVSDS